MQVFDNLHLDPSRAGQFASHPVQRQRGKDSVQHQPIALGLLLGSRNPHLKFSGFKICGVYSDKFWAAFRDI